MKSVESLLNRDLDLRVPHSLQTRWTATLSGMQKCHDTGHDAALITCGVAEKRVSAPGGCPRNSCDNRGRTAEQGTDRRGRPSMTSGEKRHILPRPYVRAREMIQQSQRWEGVSTRHEQWKGFVRRTGNCGAFACAGGPAHESSSGQIDKPAWSSPAGRSAATRCKENPSSTIDRPGG